MSEPFGALVLANLLLLIAAVDFGLPVAADDAARPWLTRARTRRILAGLLAALALATLGGAWAQADAAGRALLLKGIPVLALFAGVALVAARRARPHTR